MTNLLWSEFSQTWSSPDRAYPGADLRLYPGGPKAFPGDIPGQVAPGLDPGSTLAAQTGQLHALSATNPGPGSNLGPLLGILAIGAIALVILR